MNIKKYTLEQINSNPELHGKVFITEEDASELTTAVSIRVFAAAIKAGADEAKMMGFFSDDK